MEALVYVHTWQMGLVWWGCGVPKLVLVRAETHGENSWWFDSLYSPPLRQEGESWTVAFQLLVIFLWMSWFTTFMPLHFPTHTHPAGRWWRMGGGMCKLCAGNADSRSGFSSDLPTLGIPGNPFMNLLLVQTGLCGGGWEVWRKRSAIFLLLVNYRNRSIFWIC